MQESKLVQLKSRVSELLKGKVPSDPVFLRFLRARDFNVDKVYMKNQMTLLLYVNYNYLSLLTIRNLHDSKYVLGQRDAVTVFDLA